VRAFALIEKLSVGISLRRKEGAFAPSSKS
jgi:hypothetical protein